MAAPGALLRAAHPGPCVAVAALSGLLALSVGLPAATSATVVAAVFVGQLTIGWGNDLVDLQRDRTVGRTDKPLATGEVSARTARLALGAAALGAVGLSLLLGWRSALVHLLLTVGSGHAYNLGLKSTGWSWLPYAVAFGALPGVVTLAATPPLLPPVWVVGAAAALGVGAHLLNVIPDLADDDATGIRGLPHRLGRRWSSRLAAALLVAATLAAVLGPDGVPSSWTLLPLALVLGLAGVAVTSPGRNAFRAAVGIAVVDVCLLVVAR